MAESLEPGRRASPGGGRPEEEDDDEEREPLLPRIAWAQPRKAAPGSAVRLVETAREDGAASPGEAGDKELLLRPRDAPRCPSRSVRTLRSSSPRQNRKRPVGSGATRPFPSLRGPPGAPVAAQPGFMLVPGAQLPAAPLASRPAPAPFRLAPALAQEERRFVGQPGRSPDRGPAAAQTSDTLPLSPAPLFTRTFPRGRRLLHPRPLVVVKLLSLRPPLRVSLNFWNQTPRNP